MNDNIKLQYIDLFCGAGGTSTGVEKATFHGDKETKKRFFRHGKAPHICASSFDFGVGLP